MKTKTIVWLFVVFGIFFFFISAGGCRANTGAKVQTAPPPVDLDQLNKALEKAGEIGYGRNFLTLMVDLPQRLPVGYELFAVPLDRDRMPIRKISSFAYDPELKGKNHLWFYFFLFSPGRLRHELRPPNAANDPNPNHYIGDYVKFILVKGDETIMEKVIRRYDEWGSDTTPLIVDVPLPPAEIPGYLELKDYTFFAKGDYRKPEGYYVEGKIQGNNNGAWLYFYPTSDIRGQEPEPEVKLPTAKGWLELTNGRTHQMMEGVAPAKPYINGWWDGKGYFHPEPVKIQ